MPMPSGGARRLDARGSATELVQRIEAHLRAHVGAPFTVAALSRAVGRSERGLRNAFYGVHGVSPTRWLRAERLEMVRRALMQPGPTSTTVTRVALSCGFSELGRFAAAYRDSFGETPSATLRGHVRPRLLDRRVVQDVQHV